MKNEMLSPSRSLERAPETRIAIACFVYKRPPRTQEMLDSLTRTLNGERFNIFVFCDGPRGADDLTEVEAVRAIVERASLQTPMKIIHRSENLGLSQSILTGVDTVLKDNSAVIVIEEDLVLSKGFLRYMTTNLEKYRHEKKVASIHGYSYPTRLPTPDSFFLRGADCWGWATWADRWENFDRDAIALRQRVATQNQWLFNFGPKKVFSNMLEDTIEGRVDSWAVLWYAWAFSEGLLTLYPGKPLVFNRGNDGHGRHSPATKRFDKEMSDLCPASPRHIRESFIGRLAFSLFLTFKI